MRVNRMARQAPVFTHEGGRAVNIPPIAQLKRSLLTCMLWENGAYEDGQTVADRIASIIPKVKPEQVADLAIKTREEFKLRHAPLHVAIGMLQAGGKHRKLVGEVLSRVIQRPDELSEILAMYWEGGKKPIAKQLKKGLAAAFTKFSEYQLAKWNRDSLVKLRDVMFMVHPKPTSPEQAEVWKKLASNTLATPDTWEVGISAAKTKEERIAIWTRLMAEKKLGALALLRNLRNMEKDGVPSEFIHAAIKNMSVERVLPFRFITAAKHNQNLEPILETGMLKCLDGMEKLPGKTALIVDVSGSMFSARSAKTEETFFDNAAGLAILCRELCESVEIFSFSGSLATIPPRRGFALRDAIFHSQEHGGTYLAETLEVWDKHFNADRIIVITDEQSHDGIYTPPGVKNKYVINVAANKNGVGYGSWHHIDGFSEAVFRYIQEYEKVERESKDSAVAHNHSTVGAVPTPATKYDFKYDLEQSLPF